MKKTWLKEIARDLWAFGSIPFYFLGIIRAIIGKDSTFVYQLLISAITIFILHFIIKNSNLYVARSLVIVVFTSLFYQAMLYTVFVVLIWILLLVSVYYLKRNISAIIRGIILGIISALAGYYGTLYLL